MIRLLIFALLALLLRPVFAEGGDGWMPTVNAMSDPRWAAASVLLPNGRGLVAGGYSFPADRCVATADEFDPKTRRFTPCRGHLNIPRNFAQASSLPDGRVLISGGYNTVLGSLNTVEVFDPETQEFTLLPGRLETPRELFTATILADGRVLIVGGFNTHRGRTQASAEVYDPKTQKFRPTGSLAEDRFGQCAVRLADGRVLVAGGTHWFAGRPGVPLASAEIYDPASGRFHAPRGPMAAARDRPTAILLSDGSVLIAGGQNGASEPAQAELFDPKTETFTALLSPLITPRMAHSAETLADGTVLLSGGWSTALGATTGRAETYDPATQSFMAVPTVPIGTHDQTLLVFPGGLVLVAGGKQASAGAETSLATGYTRQFPRQ